MNFKSLRTGFITAACSIATAGLITNAAHASEFSFTATNTTRSAVTKIFVSEDKSDWGYFDVGNGIKPGATITLVWDQSTNNESCDQWMKASYADGSESEPAKFNFCEDGLEIDF